MEYGHNKLHHPLFDIPDELLYGTKSICCSHAEPCPASCLQCGRALTQPAFFFFFHLIHLFCYSGNVIQNPFYISSNQVENKWEEAENEEKEENLWEQTDDDKEKRMQESP